MKKKEREFDTLPLIKKTYTDYQLNKPIGGAEYLTTPEDDIRWWACSVHGLQFHPFESALPVVFFEVLSHRLAVTDDFDAIVYKLPLPLAIRSEFAGADKRGRLVEYLKEVLELFPGIVVRAAYIADSAPDNFTEKMTEEALADVYSEHLRGNKTPSRDIATIGAALSKLKGWDAPEQLQVHQVSDVRHILADVSNREKRIGSNFRPLPPPMSKMCLPN